MVLSFLAALVSLAGGQDPLTRGSLTPLLHNKASIFNVGSTRFAPPLSLTASQNGGQAATLVCDIDPAVNAFATTGGIIGYLQGTYLQDLTDNSGSGNNFQQTNSDFSAYCPILQTGSNGINGRPAVLFTQYNCSMQNVSSSFTANFTHGFTWIFAAGLGSQSNNYVLGGLSGFYFGEATSPTHNQFWLVAGGSTYLSPQFSEPIVVVAVTVDTSNNVARITLNGATNTFTWSGALPTSGTFNLGNGTGNGVPYSGPMGRALFFSGPLSLANTLTYCSLVANDYSLYLPVVAVYGDSFATGTNGASQPQFAIPQSIANYLGGVTQYPYSSQFPLGPYTKEVQSWSSYRVYSPYLGFSGYTAAMLGQSANLSQVTPWLNPWRPMNMAVILGEPTNSLCGTGTSGYDETASQAWNDMKALGLAIKAAQPGTCVIFCTVLPRGNGGGDTPNPTGTFESRRLAYNTILRANVGAANGYDAVADVASLVQFAGPSTPGGPVLYPSYFDTAQVHPSNAGCQLFTQIVVATIRNLTSQNYSFRLGKLRRTA